MGKGLRLLPAQQACYWCVHQGSSLNIFLIVRGCSQIMSAAEGGGGGG